MTDIQKMLDICRLKTPNHPYNVILVGQANPKSLVLLYEKPRYRTNKKERKKTNLRNKLYF